MSEKMSTRREFLLYWAGLLIVALSVVSLFGSLSSLIVNATSYNCYIPYVAQLFGVRPPPTVPQPAVNATVSTAISNEAGPSQIAYPVPYCYENPMTVVVQFVFQLLSELTFVGVGGYMMLNGRKN